MITEQLLSYLRGEFNNNRAEADIKKDLLKIGWREADINEAFLKIKPVVTSLPDTSTYYITPQTPTAPSNPELQQQMSIGLYSGGSIIVGGLLGGVFVSGWLAGENEKELGNRDKSILFKTLGIVLTISFIGINILIKNLHPDSSSSTGILNSSLAMLFGVLQQKKIKEYIAMGAKIRHRWPTVCIIVTILIWIIGIIGILASSH